MLLANSWRFAFSAGMCRPKEPFRELSNGLFEFASNIVSIAQVQTGVWRSCPIVAPSPLE